MICPTFPTHKFPTPSLSTWCTSL